MTVCDLGCASSVVCAERFRTLSELRHSGAHTPADRRADLGSLTVGLRQSELEVLRGRVT
jgi:hypothetical protein